MPNWHDDNCGCGECAADEDRFWREQGEGFDFDVTDVEDDGPCSHEFNGDRCELCEAVYNPAVHGHRIVPEVSNVDDI